MKRFLLRKMVLGGLLSAAFFFATSCKEEEKELLPTYEAGVLISNASALGSGSVSFYDRATGTVEPDLFNKVNGRSLQGNVLSMPAAFEKMFLITSNQKIEVLNSRTFTSAGVIEGLQAPQSFVAPNTITGLISESLGQADSGRVALVNLNTYQVTGTIKTGINPGAMALAGNRLFVANAGSNQVNVITVTPATSVAPLTIRLDATLTIGDNPNSMVVDGAGYLWILCSGKTNATSPASNTKGRLVRITPNNLTLAPFVFEFPGTAFQPRNLTLSVSRNRLYFLYDGVYVMEAGSAATALPKAPLINRQFQILAQDPTDGLLYTSPTAANSTTAGWVIRYRTTGAVVDSFQVQGVPNGFSFR
jgi:hypothetical protein